MRPNMMVRQDLQARANLIDLLHQANQEGQRAATDKCIARLSRLIAQAAVDELSAREIIDLISQEVDALDSKGGAAWQ